MAAPVTFTLDLEDHRPDPSWPERYPELTDRVLDLLDAWGVRGTFFVVGEVADTHRELVTRIAERGHELGLHGWRHVQLTGLPPAEFAAETARGKALLEDLGGRPVTGYRAPTFSLVPSTTWALDELAELGFAYSSSVLPARNPLWGWPGAPRHPFRWPQGLVELPAPLAAVGPAAVPYLGGTYLRLLPLAVIRAVRARSDGGEVPWTYVHAYDTDTEEPFWWVPDAGRLAPLLWVGRSRVLAKLGRLLVDGGGPPLGERLDEVPAGTVFDPSCRPTS